MYPGKAVSCKLENDGCLRTRYIQASRAIHFTSSFLSVIAFLLPRMWIKGTE